MKPWDRCPCGGKFYITKRGEVTGKVVSWNALLVACSSCKQQKWTRDPAAFTLARALEAAGADLSGRVKVEAPPKQLLEMVEEVRRNARRKEGR